MQGKISVADIKNHAKELGEDFTDREIQEMIDEADQDRKLFTSYIFATMRNIIENYS